MDTYADLTAMLDQGDYRRIGELSLDDWIFHMSIVYCSGLPDDEWEAARERHSQELADGPTDAAAELEFVWYQGGVEHREAMSLDVARSIR
ncbi:hypothetical protein [Arthrobacter sp. 35W]|uniref:hypothetical protein n=1 Tax=Arthrobacter sp. 35W TaxID=1132441 RepID=UPI0004183FD2|nr:hypothetical protein [Arthrobacter sp. 35W]